jgi:hypothetical protein
MPRLAECIERGAAGFIGKASPLGELIAAVLAAHRDEPLLDEGARHELFTARRVGWTHDGPDPTQ